MRRRTFVSALVAAIGALWGSRGARAAHSTPSGSDLPYGYEANVGMYPSVTAEELLTLPGAWEYDGKYVITGEKVLTDPAFRLCHVHVIHDGRDYRSGAVSAKAHPAQGFVVVIKRVIPSYDTDRAPERYMMLQGRVNIVCVPKT